MPHLETKISSPNAIIKIITDVSDTEKNTSDHVNDISKELEKGDREHKESSSTQTSSSSSLLHKRKSHCYYVPTGMYKPPSNYAYSLLSRPKRNVNTTSQKIISAKFIRVKQLQSELTEAQKKISDLQDENRTLRNIQKRQDSALRKYESQESHLPQLMKSHEEELRVLTIKHKKLRSAYNELESRHNKQCTELMNVKDRHKHLLQISQDKHLLQREQLTKQIEEMKTVMNDLKNKIKLQSRRLDLETKNFKYQLSTEFNKQKIIQEQLKQAQDTVQKLQIEIKDKERYMANCKINQHIISKMNQLRVKVPLNSGKSVSRICSTLGDTYTKSNGTITNEKHFNENSSPSDGTKKESTLENSSDSDDDLVSKQNFNQPNEENRKPYSFENTLPSINQNNFFYSESKSNSSDTKSSFSSYFDLDYLHKSNFSSKDHAVHNKNHSDDNNNVKRQPFDEAQNKLEPTDKKEPQDNDTNENRFTDDEFQKEHYEHETASDKSEDLKAIDETVSWLEFHEKFNHDESTKTMEVHQNDKTQVKKSNEDSLPYDKKSALLSALREIDLETEKSSTTSSKFGKNEDKADKKIIKNGKLPLGTKSLKASF